jgi:hypothetical protein
MFNRKLLAMVLGGVVGASAVHADKQGYVGALVGGQTISKGGGTGFALGANAGVMVTDVIGVGAYFSWRSKDSVTTIPFGLEANYWWKDVAPGLYTGVRFGLERSSAAGTSITPFEFGAQVGYDYAVAANFTVGGEFSYAFVMAKGTGGESHGTMTYGVTGKFWF